MAKATVPGNTAVAGITGTSTTKPTTSTTTTTSTTKMTSGGSSGSSGSSSSGTSSAATTAADYVNQFYNTTAGYTDSNDAANAAAAAAGIVTAAKNSLGTGNVTPVSNIDITRQIAALKTQQAQEQSQAAASVDYATLQGIKDLARTLEDSKSEFQTQRNQVDADEQRALDNQALYAEARGDKGGIGQEQYGSIQNTAAVNRQSVNSAEVKLQTDTSRQIADLRAQGEYEKADKMLEISNKYLTELNDLQKWAQEQNVGIDEFNSKLQEWQNEYLLDASQYLTDTQLKASELAGYFPNGAATSDTQKLYADSAEALIGAGIVPSSSQLAAMGWTPSQYWAYKMASGASA